MPRVYDLGSSFGIMQGRLSPQTYRGYQAFPWETWQREFDLAVGRGFEHIEWVLDSWRVHENPILRDTETVKKRTCQSDVSVISVCADYLMDQPLDVSKHDSWSVLNQLVAAMQMVGATWLVIPHVDQSSIRGLDAKRRFMQSTDPLTRLLDGTGIRVALETDLEPGEFATMLAELDPDVFGVNYDIGNSASLGYSYAEELDAYGQRVSLVHVKDRPLNGGSVPLGEGDANILGVIEWLRRVKFSGPVTMQAFRDADGLNVLERQLHWLQTLLKGNG